MSRDALLAEILRLPPAVDPALEDAWQAEVQRRRERLESGHDRAVPWEEVDARVFRRDE